MYKNYLPPAGRLDEKTLKNVDGTIVDQHCSLSKKKKKPNTPKSHFSH